MQKIFFEGILQLLFIFPLVFIWRNTTGKAIKRILTFCLFFLMNIYLLHLPNIYSNFDIINSRWNWEGKVYAFVGSLIFCLIFRKYLRQKNFITFRQKAGSLRYTLPMMILLGVIYILSAFFFNKSEKFDLETLIFQMAMPGLEEEIAFRGIMLSMLNTFLRKDFILWKLNLGNPGIWLSSILFGLAHGFSLGEHWQLQFNWIYFISTFNFGFLMGWITFKARSILFPILTHSLCNFLLHFTAMIK